MITSWCRKLRALSGPEGVCWAGTPLGCAAGGPACIGLFFWSLVEVKVQRSCQSLKVRSELKGQVKVQRSCQGLKLTVQTKSQIIKQNMASEHISNGKALLF